MFETISLTKCAILCGLVILLSLVFGRSSLAAEGETIHSGGICLLCETALESVK